MKSSPDFTAELVKCKSRIVKKLTLLQTELQIKSDRIIFWPTVRFLPDIHIF